jgi:hypothetical protein
VAQRLFAAQFQDFNPDPANPAIPNVSMIPVSPVNLYSAGLHRLFQEAANIYDATRNDRLPTVFRPIIRGFGGTNYIVAYTNDWSVATLAADMATDNTNGIPLVIGAKKGLPNFNEYTLRTDLTLSRKREVVYQDKNAPTNLRPTKCTSWASRTCSASRSLQYLWRFRSHPLF